ncbi:MAG: head GIN domain-containing protein [Bacteroidota bacterium]
MKLNLLALALIANFLVSCVGNSQNWGPGISGQGPKVTKTLDLSAFESVGLSISADVYLRQGSTQSVKIEAQQNIIDNLVKNVENGKWKIKFDKNVREQEGVKIWITVPTLKDVAVSGSGDIIGESPFKNLGDIHLAISGSGSIQLDADSKSLGAAVSGSGDMKLAGATGGFEIAISGSGNIESFDLSSKTCEVSIAGSGDASVNASESLQVSIAGSGDVFYKGSPKVQSKISGSGDVVAK